MLREHRVCYAENNRNNEKEESNAKRRREKLKPDQILTKLRCGWGGSSGAQLCPDDRLI